MRRLADAATAAGLRPLVRPHPAEDRARYAEFGAFYVGRVVEPREWVRALVGA